MDGVSLSVSNQRATTGTCEICRTTGAVRAARVVVKHTNSAPASFLACSQCAKAVSRVATPKGGDDWSSQVGAKERAISTLPKAIRRRPGDEGLHLETREVLGEAPNYVLVDGEGKQYLIQLCGGRRSDGKWVGWLEFPHMDTDQVLRTGRETTQPDRSALLRWARGTGPVYFEGAFNRAR
jgi:hypothetical protein